MLAQFLRRRVDALAVGGQLDIVGRGIPLRIEFAAGATGEIERHQGETVGLETGAFHRAVVDCLAVGAEDRAGIPGGIGRGQVLRRFRPCNRREEDVEVRRPGLGLAGDAHAEGDGLSVRRPGEFINIAERLGRDVAVDAATEFRRLAGQLAVGPEARDEELVAPAIGPGIPMPDEDLVEDDAARLARSHFVDTLLAAVERVAIVEHFESQGDRLAVRRKLVTADVHRVVRQLHRLAAGHRLRPQLHRTGLGRQEIDGFSVRRKGRTVDAHALGGEAQGRRRIARDQILDPQAGAALVGVQIGLAHGEDDATTIRRQYRAGDAIERGHVADVQRARGLRGGRQQGAHQQGQESVTKHHAGSTKAGKRCRHPPATQERINAGQRS